MKPYYSKKAIQRFTNPKHFGNMKKPDATGEVGNIRCGDIMKIYLKVDDKKGKKIIKDISFQTLGCAAAVATSDVICDLAKGKTFEDALKIDYKKVTDELGYLPTIKIHCAQLAQQGLKAAIEDYESPNRSKSSTPKLRLEELRGIFSEKRLSDKKNNL